MARSPGRWSRIGRRLVAGFLVLLALSMLVVAVRQTIYLYTDLPYWDQWASLRKLQHFVEQGPSLTYFWHQHNEHRLFVPRLFFLADAFFFRLDNVLLLVVVYLTQAAHLLLFILIAYRSLHLCGAALWATVGALGTLLFNPLQDANFVWGFQIQVVGVFFLMTLTSYCMATHLSGAPDLLPGGGRDRWLVVCLIAACAANYTWAAGITIWPVLGLVMLLLRPVRRRTLLAFLAVALLTLTSYLWGYRAPIDLGEPQAMSGHLLDILRYMVHYLGGPAGPLSATAGAIGLSTLVVAVSYALAKRPEWSRNPGVVTCLAVMSSITCSAFLTAIGRLDLGFVQARSARYATPALVFWSAAGLLVIQLLRGSLSSAGSRRRRALAAAAVLAITWLGYRGFRSARSGRERPEVLRRAEAAVLAGRLDSAALAEMSPYDEEFMRERIAFLARQGWSVFGRRETDTAGPAIKRAP